MITSIHIQDDLLEASEKKMRELGFKKLSAFVQEGLKLLIGQDKQSYRFMCQYREGDFKIEPGTLIHLVLLDRLAKDNGDIENKTFDNIFYVNEKRELVTGETFYNTRKEIYAALRDKVANVRKKLVQLRADTASEQILCKIEEKTIKEKALCE